MITREEVQRLAAFQAPDNTAITFFFCPSPPQDRSHKAEANLIKGLLREHISRAGEIDSDLGQDLQRIQQLANEPAADDMRGKVIFACRAAGIWEEFDVPSGGVDVSSIDVGRRFCVKPLVAALESAAVTCIVLLDREVNRLLRLSWGKLTEETFPQGDVAPREVRAVGTGDSTKSERRVGDEVMHHFKQIAAHLLHLAEHGEFDQLMLGGRDEILPVFERYLPTEVSRKLLGTFHCDPRLATHDEIADRAECMLAERRLSDKQGTLREIEGQAKRGALGAVGIHDVLQSLERGEVQHLAMTTAFAARGAECPHCSHLQAGPATECPVCGQQMLDLEDLSDALIAHAFASGADLTLLNLDDGDLQSGVGALLRFRADQNTPEKLAS